MNFNKFFNIGHFSLIYFFWNFILLPNGWFYAFQLKFKLDMFDSSLRLVSGLYTISYYKLCDDFGFLYTPGLVVIN